MRALTILFITLQFVKGAIKVFKSHIKVIHSQSQQSVPSFHRSVFDRHLKINNKFIVFVKAKHLKQFT